MPVFEIDTYLKRKSTGELYTALWRQSGGVAMQSLHSIPNAQENNIKYNCVAQWAHRDESWGEKRLLEIR